MFEKPETKSERIANKIIAACAQGKRRERWGSIQLSAEISLLMGAVQHETKAEIEKQLVCSIEAALECLYNYDDIESP